MGLSSRQIVEAWSVAFNHNDVNALTALYAGHAVNWQVAEEPLRGRKAIRESFRLFFRAFPDAAFRTINLLEDGEWAALEWEGWGTQRGEFAGHSPSGPSFELRGCGFFQVRDGQIVYQRGYWDRVSWFRHVGLPV